LIDSKVVAEANQLIRYGLVPHLYGRQNEYHELASRYRINHDFRTAVDAAANGLGLKIVEATDLGIYLAVNDTTSPFTPDAMSVSKSCSNVETRQLIGLCFLGIAAVAFERPGSLHSDNATFVSVNEVFERLVGIAQDVYARGLDGGLSEAAAIILNHKHLNTSSKTEKPTKDTLHWHILTAFDFLEKQRLVKLEEPNKEGGFYGTLPRFRALLASGGLSNLYRIVKESVERHREAVIAAEAAKEEH